MIKKGQLRRWKEGWGWMAGKTFVTVGSRVHKLNPGELRRELGWGSYHRGRRIWTIMMDGGLEYEEHMEIERGSEVIDDSRGWPTPPVEGPPRG